MSSVNVTRRDILYVITDLQRGGVPLHLYRLACAMRDRGFEPCVVSLAPPGPVAEMLQGAGIGVRSCQGRGGWDFRVVTRLARILREHQPDIVHSLLFHANLATRWAARWAGLDDQRVICEIQTVEVERRWHLVVDRFTHWTCRFTIGNSPSVIEHLHSGAGIPRDRLRLVRGGIDPEPIRQAQPLDRASLGVPKGTPLVLWTGRLDPVKGLDILIRAFREVLQKSRAYLLLVGEGPLRASLKDQIGRLGFAAHVCLLGPREDVPSLLKTADVFVFPSRTEGLPNALLEAMAAGCPIVTTNVPGCRDLIDHGRSGLMVPYGDPAALAAAMLSLLHDHALGKRLGAYAAEIVPQKWHFKNTLEAYTTIYEELHADG